MSKISNLRIEPFSTFSAEEEKDILENVFFYPSFYSQLLQLIKDGNSRFILGQRGQGKSAIIYRMLADLQKSNTLPLLVTNYDGIPANNNSCHFIYKIVQTATLGIAKHFFYSPKLIKKMSSSQKQKFNVLVEMFYDPSWAPEFMEQAKAIKAKKRHLCFAQLFNKNLKLINKVSEGVVKVTSKLIRESLGLPSSEDGDYTFFESINLPAYKTFSINDVNENCKTDLIGMLNILLGIVDTIGLKSIVVLFDQIDEYSLLNSDTEAVSVFMADLLKDTNFLYTSKLGVVFSLWSEAKNCLNVKGVRFDKFQDIDIRWKDEDLVNIVNKRLLFYSDNMNSPVSLESLIPDDELRNTVVTLAGKSPRSLIILLNKITYSEENDNVNAFNRHAIENGMLQFCKSFDYISLLPNKLSKREDINSWICKVLATRRHVFTPNQYSESVGVKKKTLATHLDELKKIGFIKEQSTLDSEGNKLYEVTDPRLRHLISRGVLSIED